MVIACCKLSTAKSVSSIHSIGSTTSSDGCSFIQTNCRVWGPDLLVHNTQTCSLHRDGQGGMHVQSSGSFGFATSQYAHALFMGLVVMNISGVFYHQDGVFSSTSLHCTLLMDSE